MAMAWSLRPRSFDEKGLVSKESVPDSLEGKEVDEWSAAIHAFPSLSIALVLTGVAEQSLAAAKRYSCLHPLEDKYPCWSLLKVLCAEVHYLMNDAHGAHERLGHVQNLIGQGSDLVLDNALVELSKILAQEEQDDEEEDEQEDQGGMKVMPYMRPAEFQDAACCWDAQETINKWGQVGNARVLAAYTRHAAICTNVLEGVFDMDDGAWSGLVSAGFHAELLDRVPKPQKIIDILEDTVACLGLLKFEPCEYDEDMIKDIHKKLISSGNNDEESEEGTFAVLVPRGVYRRVACYALNPSQGIETRFCPWSQLATEMLWYIEQAQALLESPRGDADPFLLCAWLQRTFLRIHPFADGNGRVARIISSIPLLKAGLPPAVVSSKRKLGYFDTLISADETGDLVPLAAFLKAEMDTAIADVVEMSN